MRAGRVLTLDSVQSTTRPVARWIWQRDDWPQVTRGCATPEAEDAFLADAEALRGHMARLDETARNTLIVDALAWDGWATSAIEGEFLSRSSLQSSLRRRLGLPDEPGAPNGRREQGLAEMLLSAMETWRQPLTAETMKAWQRTLCGHRLDLDVVGEYRTSPEPMQVVSARAGHPSTVHYEAPPSAAVADEMAHFVRWFNDSEPGGAQPMPAVQRAAWAHHHFVTIHPFEDGNGRIARQLAGKALVQGAESSIAPALATAMEQHRSQYYDALKASQRFEQPRLDVWMQHFAEMVAEGQAGMLSMARFAAAQAMFWDEYRDALSANQSKVAKRLFEAGPAGFLGGLSTKNYATIAKIPEQAAARDIADMVALGALRAIPTPRARADSGARFELALR